MTTARETTIDNIACNVYWSARGRGVSRDELRRYTLTHDDCRELRASYLTAMSKDWLVEGEMRLVALDVEMRVREIARGEVA